MGLLKLGLLTIFIVKPSHHDSHSVRVTTEVCNMIVDPLQCQQLQAGTLDFSPQFHQLSFCDFMFHIDIILS